MINTAKIYHYFKYKIIIIKLKKINRIKTDTISFSFKKIKKKANRKKS